MWVRCRRQWWHSECPAFKQTSGATTIVEFLEEWIRPHATTLEEDVACSDGEDRLLYTHKTLQIGMPSTGCPSFAISVVSLGRALAITAGHPQARILSLVIVATQVFCLFSLQPCPISKVHTRESTIRHIHNCMQHFFWLHLTRTRRIAYGSTRSQTRWLSMTRPCGKICRSEENVRSSCQADMATVQLAPYCLCTVAIISC